MEKNLLTFEQALSLANKEGYVIRRESWPNNVCVFLQIPATINEDIVPKMTSLSEKTKTIILNTAKRISYNNQAIQYNMSTGAATYYIPTIEDSLAIDWRTIK